ncbi:DUF6427 family protein [Flavobacteriales bacterium]|jgi:hypothetical protein|nr:DUF6427 family protein [Flavobacteriales bacterium]MDB2622382.1 DUF6427 family protein [Flavobacteriales bacterium]
MVVNLFRHTQSISILILMALCGMLWMGLSFQSLEPSIDGASPFLSPLYNWLKTHVYLERICLGILIFSQCISMNRMMAKQKVISINSSFPALFYFLLISTSPNGIYLSPSLISMSFILAALNKILNTYLKKEAYNHVFESAFFLSIATLIHPPFFVFTLLVWIGMSIFSQVEWRHWAISFLGVICPWFLFYTTVTFFSAADLNAFNFFESLLPINSTTKIDAGDFLTLFVFGVVSLLSIFELLISLRQKNIKARKSYVLFLWILILGAVYFYFSEGPMYEKLRIFALPLSAIMSNYFYYNNKRTWLNSLAFVLLCALFVNHLLFQ